MRKSVDTGRSVDLLHCEVHSRSSLSEELLATASNGSNFEFRRFASKVRLKVWVSNALRAALEQYSNLICLPRDSDRFQDAHYLNCIKCGHFRLKSFLKAARTAIGALSHWSWWIPHFLPRKAYEISRFPKICSFSTRPLVYMWILIFIDEIGLRNCSERTSDCSSFWAPFKWSSGKILTLDEALWVMDYESGGELVRTIVLDKFPTGAFHWESHSSLECLSPVWRVNNLKFFFLLFWILSFSLVTGRRAHHLPFSLF